MTEGEIALAIEVLDRVASGAMTVKLSTPMRTRMKRAASDLRFALKDPGFRGELGRL